MSAISSFVNSKSKTLKFSAIMSGSVDFGMTERLCCTKTRNSINNYVRPVVCGRKPTAACHVVGVENVVCDERLILEGVG